MKRILIVDDDIDILEVLQIAFEAKGHEVSVLPDAGMISEHINKFSPGVILLDVFLGDMNGVTICRQLKSDPDTRHIAVILFSALANNNTIINNCPADAFIGKPFNLNQLIELVEQV